MRTVGHWTHCRSLKRAHNAYAHAHNNITFPHERCHKAQDAMNRPQHSSLVTALSELSWSDVKRMAIHLDESIDLPLLNDIEREYPIEERLMYTMKAWLERDCEASWDKIVSALQRIGQNVLAKKIESKVATQITAPCPPADRRPEGDQPVVSPPVKLQPSPELPFLHQESELSASLVPAFDHSCTDGQARKIDEKQHSIMQSITASNPVTLHGQTESGPPVVSPVELQPSPGPDSLHQLQPDTVIRTRLEPACAHSASVSQGRDSDQTRAQLTTEQETSDSDCPTVPQQDSEISGWRRERRQQISNVAIMAAIVGAALAAAESGDSAISLVLTGTGLFAAMIAFGVTLSIVLGVPTGSRKHSVFVTVVVAVLVGAGTVRIASTTARTSATASRATVAVAMEAERNVFLFAVHGIGIITALGAVAFAVLIAEAVLPVIVAVAAGAVTIGAGAGVMVAEAVISATAAVMAVAAAGAATARGPAQAAEAAARAAAAAVAALAVAVVTAAVGAPVLKTAAVGLAAVAAVAAAAVVYCTVHVVY